MWLLEVFSSTFLMKGSMHLSPPMKRYVATFASQGSNLENRETRKRGGGDVSPAGRLYSRSCEDGDVHEPRDADHLLLGQDGFHGLLDGVERLQRGDQAPQLLPAAPVRGRIFQCPGRTVKVNKASPDFAACEHARVHDVRAHQGGFHAIRALRQQLVRQRLVEPDGSKFTGAVILGEEGCQVGMSSGGVRMVHPTSTQAVLKSPRALATVTM